MIKRVIYEREQRFAPFLFSHYVNLKLFKKRGIWTDDNIQKQLSAFIMTTKRL